MSALWIPAGRGRRDHPVCDGSHSTILPRAPRKSRAASCRRTPNVMPQNSRPLQHTDWLECAGSTALWFPVWSAQTRLCSEFRFGVRRQVCALDSRGAGGEMLLFASPHSTFLPRASRTSRAASCRRTPDYLAAPKVWSAQTRLRSSFLFGVRRHVCALVSRGTRAPGSSKLQRLASRDLAPRAPRTSRAASCRRTPNLLPPMSNRVHGRIVRAGSLRTIDSFPAKTYFLICAMFDLLY